MGISFYGLFVGVGGCKTPKYRLVSQIGYYPEMEQLKGKDGYVSLYLQESNASGHTKDNAPKMRLQGKNSFPFTGLKEHFICGKLSGCAYGYPPDTKTYGKVKIYANPLYNHKQDAFLFLYDATEAPQPKSFELLIIDQGKTMAGNLCTQLAMGGFDDELKTLRAQAEAVKV